MCAWFRKKKKADLVAEVVLPPPDFVPPQEVPRPVATGPAQSVLTWHGEISEVRQGFQRYLEQASSESEADIASMGNNLAVLQKVWDPAERELEVAQKNLTHAWNRAKSAMGREKLDKLQRDQRDNLYDVETGELEFDFEQAHRNARAQAANALMQSALHSDARSRVCVSCHQPMVNLLVGQAQNMNCPACGTAQTVEPGNDFRMFAASAALWVGEWEAFGSWRNMKRAEILIQQYHDRVDVPLDLLKEFHDAAQVCWGTTFGVEGQLVPQGASHIPRKVEARMKDAFRLLREHWQWREFESTNP